MESASAVPVIVGVVLFVADISTKEVGASGAVVSIVIDRVEESGEIFLHYLWK